MANVVNYDAGEVFSGKKSSRLVPGFDAPSPYTPQTNSNYMYPVWTHDIVIWLVYMNEPLWIYGPTGCGKTSCVKQIVSRLNYPVYEVTGHNRLEFPEMVGHHTVQQGSMHFEYGPLVMAMKTGGVFLVNEIDLLTPDTAAGLNSILDGYPLSIPENGGELITPHPLFRSVATANSNGSGDSTGLYQGMLRQNIAFQDRFTMVKADYPTADVEEAVLTRMFPNIPQEIVQKMVKFANHMRKLFVGDASGGVDEQIELTCSTRTLIRWAYLIQAYDPMRQRGVDVVGYALDRALVFRAQGATISTLNELYQRVF